MDTNYTHVLNVHRPKYVNGRPKVLSTPLGDNSNLHFPAAHFPRFLFDFLPLFIDTPLSIDRLL